VNINEINSKPMREILFFAAVLQAGSVLAQPADLVVLDKDIFSIPPREVLSTSVGMTVMDGKIVYRKK